MPMTYDDLRQLCENRRSVRYFDTKPIAKEEITELLDLAHVAPSIENTQPWRFHVVMGAELREKLMSASCYGNFVEGASAFVVVTARKDALPSTLEILWNPRELEYSCLVAMSYVLLGATAKGLGSCWVSLHHGEAHAFLNLPLNEAVVGGIMLGHLRKGESMGGTKPERRPLSEFVTFHD